MIEKDELQQACDLLLRHYYDKLYNKNLLNHRPDKKIYQIESQTLDASVNADHVLHLSRHIFNKPENNVVSESILAKLPL
jgi:hypothetical protein